jgi:hypothetical protein
VDGPTFAASVIGSVAWPVVALIALFLFRRPISSLLAAVLRGRVRRIKLGPFEIEIGDGEGAQAPTVRLRNRGLSRERIDVEAALYDAIRRLESSRALYDVATPAALEEDISAFWEQPESLGFRPGGEKDVVALTHRVLELVAPELRREASDSIDVITDAVSAEVVRH